MNKSIDFDINCYVINKHKPSLRDATFDDNQISVTDMLARNSTNASFPYSKIQYYEYVILLKLNASLNIVL